MELIQPLRGIITAMVTPLRNDGTLDHEGLERLIEHLIEGGVQGLFPLGTTGEAPALPYSLRMELVERVCRQVRGRVPVIVGITDPSYDEACGMAKAAADSGADAVVAAPPYYYTVDQADLLQYFTALASDVPLPLFLYNAPLNTHLTLSVATVRRAAEIPNVRGVKDSGLSMIYFHQVRLALASRPDFTLLVGPDELLADAVIFGGHGGMAAGSNVFPNLFVSLYKAAAAGDLPKVTLLQSRAMEFSAAVYRANPLRGLKCALSVMGICGETTAQPLQPYSETEKAEVRRYLEGVRPELAGAFHE